MWPLAVLGVLAAGAWWVWSQIQPPALPGPPLAPPAPGGPPAPPALGPAPPLEHLSYTAPMGTLLDGATIGLGAAALGMLRSVGACQTSTPSGNAQGQAAYRGLVAQRQGAVWAFQRAVGLPTTGCYDAVTAAALAAWLPGQSNLPAACNCAAFPALSAPPPMNYVPAGPPLAAIANTNPQVVGSVLLGGGGPTPPPGVPAGAVFDGQDGWSYTDASGVTTLYNGQGQEVWKG